MSEKIFKIGTGLKKTFSYFVTSRCVAAVCFPLKAQLCLMTDALEAGVSGCFFKKSLYNQCHYDDGNILLSVLLEETLNCPFKSRVLKLSRVCSTKAEKQQVGSQRW